MKQMRRWIQLCPLSPRQLVSRTSDFRLLGLKIHGNKYHISVGPIYNIGINSTPMNQIQRFPNIWGSPNPFQRFFDHTGNTSIWGQKKAKAHRVFLKWWYPIYHSFKTIYPLSPGPLAPLRRGRSFCAGETCTGGPEASVVPWGNPWFHS